MTFGERFEKMAFLHSKNEAKICKNRFLAKNLVGTCYNHLVSTAELHFYCYFQGYLTSPYLSQWSDLTIFGQMAIGHMQKKRWNFLWAPLTQWHGWLRELSSIQKKCFFGTPYSTHTDTLVISFSGIYLHFSSILKFWDLLLLKKQCPAQWNCHVWTTLINLFLVFLVETGWAAH